MFEPQPEPQPDPQPEPLPDRSLNINNCDVTQTAAVRTAAVCLGHKASSWELRFGNEIFGDSHSYAKVYHKS